MKTSARSLPVVPLALAASLLTAFLVLFAPLSASAHDALVSSSPEADSTVEVLPAEVALTFSEDLITGTGATEIAVTDSSGTSVTVGEPIVSGATVTQLLVEGAQADRFHVVWKIVSSDGHPTSGEYWFLTATSTLVSPTAAPSASATPEPTSESPTATAPAEPVQDQPNFVGLGLIALIVLLTIAALVGMFMMALRSRRPSGSDDSSER